jgi:heme/copper-type cytochrome/quinol oxidase subunit 3
MSALPPPVGAGRTIDVRDLPSFGFSHRSLMWWATLGLMLIEGTVFLLALLSYFYLRDLAAGWPIAAAAPALRWGTLNSVLLLASMWPNHLAKRAAQRMDLGATRLWMSVCLAAALAFLAIRWMEFTVLNVTWSQSAYGSIVWFLLGLHTTHLITDTIDTGVLTALLFIGPFERRRYVDVSENAMYWYFVVWSWLPIYAVVYFGPRM